MKRLFLCNTPYQLIVTILLVAQISSSGDENDIIITDNFVRSDNLVQTVSLSKYFDKVFHARINEYMFPKTNIKKIKKLLSFFTPRSCLSKSIFPKIDYYYDEIFYNNDDLFLYNLVFICAKRNKFLKIFRFEEGYSSYIVDFCSLRGQHICEIRDKLNGVKSFRKLLCGMFFYEPELVMYDLEMPILKISRERLDDIRPVIGTIFSVSSQYMNISENWIIFEESFYQDTGYNYDLKLYNEVIKIVGKKNVIVKLHPRSKTNRFDKEGIKTFVSDGVPWEAVMLSTNMLGKQFIALASGSIINTSLLIGDSCESWLLYRCLDKSIPIFNDDFEKLLNNFIRKKIVKNIHVPTSNADMKMKLQSK